MRPKLSIARSRCRKGRCEFSTRLLAQRPFSCFSASPARSSPPGGSVARRWRWARASHAVERLPYESERRALSLVLVMQLLSTSPSWSTGKQALHKPRRDRRHDPHIQLPVTTRAARTGSAEGVFKLLQQHIHFRLQSSASVRQPSTITPPLEQRHTELIL